MNNSTEILFTIGQIIGAFSTLIVFVATIVIFIKKKTIATWLIFSGYLLVVITYIVSLFINVFAGRNGIESLLITQGVLSIVQNLSYSIFAVGLLILGLTEFSKKNKTLN
ncbi:hypothetical protein [Winogradskyella helgolandensis]|uniref:hypothetical protein n=1 Tax=Winogradskyella helgolandensis TaxID=2697010 RepID=UPI0015BC53FF|nr:hypothetical protein [Winogradskyella helgolandensis]